MNEQLDAPARMVRQAGAARARLDVLVRASLVGLSLVLLRSRRRSRLALGSRRDAEPGTCATPIAAIKNAREAGAQRQAQASAIAPATPRRRRRSPGSSRRRPATTSSRSPSRTTGPRSRTARSTSSATPSSACARRHAAARQDARGHRAERMPVAISRLNIRGAAASPIRTTSSSASPRTIATKPRPRRSAASRRGRQMKLAIPKIELTLSRRGRARSSPTRAIRSSTSSASSSSATGRSPTTT